MSNLQHNPQFSLTTQTLAYYERQAEAFRQGTWDHDVTQNYAAFLGALADQPPPLQILDLGCGPGRDVVYFKEQGHQPTGLDGCAAFCQMVAQSTGCPVLHQNFLSLDLPKGQFQGVFANASLFHVPSAELSRILGEIGQALRPGGILFSSNPRGNDEGFQGERYGCYMELETYHETLIKAGFKLLDHFYRPPGKPCAEQPWLATVSRWQG